MGDVLAEAVVELEADVDKFNKDFKKSLKQAENDAKQSTDEIDKAFKHISGNLGKEFELAAKEFARQQREQEREAKRVAREIEAENRRVQREIEAETRRVQREIERETARVARENVKAQREYEREFIASQRAMENEARETQERQAARFRSHIAALRKFASERFSLSLGVDTSQLTNALASVSKLGALLGALGVGALAGQASLAGIASLTVAVQELVGAIALLPAVGVSAGLVVGTLTLGLRGLSDAFKADSPAEFAEALEKLSDNGKNFAKAVRELKDEFDDLGKSVQQELFANLGDELTKLAQAILPSLRQGFTGIAKELNLGARALAAFTREAQTINDVDRIFANTRQSVMIFHGALLPLAGAFRDLATVGSNFLPVIAADLAGVAKRFGDFVSEARASGELAAFFERAVQAVRDFVAVLGNLGSIFDAVMDAAESSLGGGFLSLLKTATQSVEDFVESARGQTALIQFFEGAQEAAKLILPILGDLARLILEVVLPAFTKLGTVAAPGLNMLVDGLRRGLENAIPGIIDFVDSLSSIVVSLVDAGVLDALGDLVKILGSSLGAAVRSVAPTLGDLINSVLLKLAEILPKILPALGKFADAFGDLVIAALPVVDVLASIISDVGLPTLQRIAEKLTPIIEKLASGISDALLPVLPELADAFAEWVDALAPIAGDLGDALVDLFKILAPLLPSIVRSFVELTDAVRPFVALLTGVVDFIAKFVTKLYEIPGVKKFMEEELPGILALLTGMIIVPIARILELLNSLFDKLNQAGVFDLMLESLSTLGAALTFLGDVMERVGQIAQSIWNFIVQVVQTAIQIIIAIISTGFSIIEAVFTTAWEIIKAIFRSAWEFIKIIAQTALQLIIALITGNFNAIPGIIGGALQRARDAVADGFNRILDLARDLPNRIVSALGNLGGLLYGVGQSLVQGMINGIRSMIGALANQAASMAADALNAAKRALGISSPSKVMMTVGEDFGQGFVLGIDKMLKKAASAGADLATETAQSTTTALGPADNSIYRMNETLNRLTRNGLGPAPVASSPVATTAEQGAVVVNPEVRVYIGNDEINNHITDVVDERDRRTKRAVTMGARRTV